MNILLLSRKKGVLQVVIAYKQVIDLQIYNKYIWNFYM